MTEYDRTRYPIGPFHWEAETDGENRFQSIERIARHPEELRMVTSVLSELQLDKPYREGGWTIRQVVHHIVDSHINGYTRMHLALTENEAAIRLYDQDAWAELPDAKNGPIEMSLNLLNTLVKRWLHLLMNLEDEDFTKGYYHPEAKRVITLEESVALYAWHGDHHIAHIHNALDG